MFFVALLLFCASCSERQEAVPAQTTDIDTVPMMVMQIRKCARLHTAEYRLHKIVTHDDQMKLRGTVLAQQFDITLPFGNRKIAIPMDATVKAYIDFSGFSEKNVRRSGHRIEVILPDPKVELTSSRINHREIKKQVSIVRSDFSDEEMANYERQGRAAILSDVPRTGIIEMARENAANVLIPMIEQMGYKQNDIKITFRKKFTIDDLPALIDKRTTAR